MITPKAAQDYFDAWNRRDAAGIVACFTGSGAYCDPTAGDNLRGGQIAAYATGLWTAFPDLRFEVGRIAATGDGVLAAEWRMLGTNTGAFNGLPPAGRTVDLPGVDIMEPDGNKLASVTGYFDSRAVPEQLGLKVNVQPQRLGPFAFGSSTYVQSGNLSRPGALSTTCLMARSDEETNAIREQGREVLKEMLKLPGFISALTATGGDRMFTVAAWESPEHSRAMYSSASHAHKHAMTRFFQAENGLGDGGITSVWSPLHTNAFWRRCADCGHMFDCAGGTGACACGAPPPAPVPYW
ncbi:MAG: ester cyclase [Gammaproteobacteria bacterium]